MPELVVLFLRLVTIMYVSVCVRLSLSLSLSLCVCACVYLVGKRFGRAIDWILIQFFVHFFIPETCSISQTTSFNDGWMVLLFSPPASSWQGLNFYHCPTRFARLRWILLLEDGEASSHTAGITNR